MKSTLQQQPAVYREDGVELDPAYMVVGRRAHLTWVGSGKTLCGLKLLTERARHGEPVCRKCSALANAHDPDAVKP